MPLRAAIFVFAMALLGFAVPATAQQIDTAGDAAATSTQTGSSQAGTASSAINSTVGSAFPGAFGSINAGIPAVSNYSAFPAEYASPTTVQGCGGVGQAEYTSGLFNMPEVFDKFKNADIDSLLAKQILTLNYSMPQTSALFDTLNSYGNQRYDQFQRACNISSLQKDARNDYLNQCVKQQVPLRKDIIQKNNQQGGSITMSEQVLDAQAYAQAWEICSMQYVSDTNAYATWQQSNEQFGKKVRQTENVTAALAGLLCMDQDTTKVGDVANAQTCWPLLMLPSVKLCNMDDPTQCTGGADVYGIQPPILSMQQYFNMLRYTVEKGIVQNVAMPVQNQLANLSKLTRVDASNNATQEMNANPPAAKLVNNNTKVITQGFQYHFLNCTNPDILYPMQQFVDAVNNGLKQNTSTNSSSQPTPIDMPTFEESQYTDIVKSWGGILAGQSQSEQIAQLNMTVLGCMANQVVPIFDPGITASLSTQCLLDKDIPAFYAVSSYDLAYLSTKEVYQYLELRLQQIYGRLMHDTIVPNTSDNSSAGTASSSHYPSATIVSPELNKRMAGIIKDVMLPQINQDLKRLQQFNSARGEFSQRVQLIYAQRSGCVYPPSTGGNSGTDTSGAQ